MRNLTLSVLLLAALCACRPSVDRADSQESLAEEGVTGAGAGRSAGNPVARGAENVTAETPLENLAVAPTEPDNGSGAETNSGNTAESNTGAAATAPVIPVRYRSRWGMVPADCTSTRGDAKGLITVGDRTIRFYESTGTLTERLPGAATSLAGEFAFTGEGMTWAKTMTLMVQGDTLSRTEDGQVYRYTRCR